MPLSTGFNHVATLTADLDRMVHFYQTVFDAAVTFEMDARDDHPRMVILELGGGSALNITEQPASGHDRRRPIKTGRTRSDRPLRHRRGVPGRPR
jgi:catechol 2,3-dioxygenase-like lactoylglutathione lyase family enzyme